MNILERLKSAGDHIEKIVHFANLAAGQRLTLTDADGNEISSEDVCYNLWRELDRPDNLCAEVAALFSALATKERE